MPASAYVPVIGHETNYTEVVQLWASLHGGPRVSRTRAESARQHDGILTALSDGDPASASAQTHQHIMGADPVKEMTE